MANLRSKIVFALLLVSCTGHHNEPGPVPRQSVTPTSPIAPVPSENADGPATDTIARYVPPTKYHWWAEPVFLELKIADVPVANDYFQWFESIYNQWDKSILSGHVPKVFLDRFPNGPDHIEYVDETHGTVKGIEKLQSVFPHMLTRCPTLNERQFKAALRVRWQDRFQPGTAGNFLDRKVNLGDHEDGSVWPIAVHDWASEIEIRGEYVKPANTLEGWRGYQYPRQTMLEITGGKSFADGGTIELSLDKTFAHELGHFFVQAWALNNGRSPTQSFMFSEFIAETLRVICWGDYLDNPARVKDEVERGKSPFDPRPFGIDEKPWQTVSRRHVGANYGLYSFQSLLAWKKFKNEFDADAMIRAIFETMSNMTGLVINDYPAYDESDHSLLTPLLPWSRSISNPEIIRRAPVIFTKQEFLAKFCLSYDCGELKFLIEADAAGNHRSEW